MLKKGLLFCLAIIIMGILDWLTTLTGVFYFGAVEINPLFAGLTNTNILAFSAIKLSVVMLTGFLFYKADKIEKMLEVNSHLGKRFLQSGYCLSLTILTAVVANNIIIVVSGT